MKNIIPYLLIILGSFAVVYIIGAGSNAEWAFWKWELVSRIILSVAVPIVGTFCCLIYFIHHNTK